MGKIIPADLRAMWAKKKAESCDAGQYDSLINENATKIRYCHKNDTATYQAKGWRRTTLQVLKELFPTENWK